MKHILGAIGSKVYNMDTRQEDYAVKMLVSNDVIDWLECHDVKIDSKGRKIYVCNQVEYLYLGIQLPAFPEGLIQGLLSS